MARKFVPQDNYGWMDAYLPRGGATGHIMDRVRTSVFRESRDIIPNSEIDAAKSEMKQLYRAVDEMTPFVAQDFNSRSFGAVDIRAFLLIRADIVTSTDSIETVLHYDLGINPWPLFKGSDIYNTVDARLTLEKLREFMTQHDAELHSLGATGMMVKGSTFHFARDDELKAVYANGDGQIDYLKLVPDIVDTSGYVGLTGNVPKPEGGEYMRRSIEFTQLRQKKSLYLKAERELCDKDPFDDWGDVISDISGFRHARATGEGAIAVGDGFSYLDRLGRFNASVIHVDDYYRNPKKTGFQSFNIAIRLSSAHHARPVVHEFQIYDLMWHFNAQIYEKHRAHHVKVRAQQERSLKKRKGILCDFGYDTILKEIFGDPTHFEPIGKK